MSEQQREKYKKLLLQLYDIFQSKKFTEEDLVLFGSLSFCEDALKKYGNQWAALEASVEIASKYETVDEIIAELSTVLTYDNEDDE